MNAALDPTSAAIWTVVIIVGIIVACVVFEAWNIRRDDE